MKKLPLLLIPFYILLVTSCQKEVSSADVANGGADSITGTLLAKTITISHSNNAYDSVITEFTYDVSNKLSASAQNSILYDSSSGITYKQFIFSAFERDVQGRVIKWYYGGRDPDKTNRNDTFATSFFYTSSTSTQVSYEIVYGINQYDSNAYIRNTAGQVITIKNYWRSKDSIVQTGYQDFTYDGNNNVTQIKVYGFSDGSGNHPDGLAFTYNYQYDDKINPFYTGDDIMPQWVWVDPRKMHNNALLYTQETNADASPGNELIENHTQTFTYRQDGFPLSSVKSNFYTPDVGPRSTSKTTYFYK